MKRYAKTSVAVAALLVAGSASAVGFWDVKIGELATPEALARLGLKGCQPTGLCSSFDRPPIAHTIFAHVWLENWRVERITVGFDDMYYDELDKVLHEQNGPGEAAVRPAATRFSVRLPDNTETWRSANGDTVFLERYSKAGTDAHTMDFGSIDMKSAAYIAQEAAGAKEVADKAASEKAVRDKAAARVKAAVLRSGRKHAFGVRGIEVGDVTTAEALLALCSDTSGMKPNGGCINLDPDPSLHATSLSVQLQDWRVQEISLGIESENYDEFDRTLRKKYGPPNDVWHTPRRNAFGTVYVYDAERWTDAGGNVLTLQRYISNDPTEYGGAVYYKSAAAATEDAAKTPPLKID